MEELMKYYNNKNFIIYINSNEYNARFKIVDDVLGFETKHNDEIGLEILIKKFNSLNGKFENKDIVMIKPYVIEYTDEKIVFKIDIMLIGFWLGKNIYNKKIKKINYIYWGTDGFSEYKHTDIQSLNEIKLKMEQDDYIVKSGNLSFFKTNSIQIKRNELNIKNEQVFKYTYEKNVSVFKAIKDIWHLKNLLSIFSKKEIGVKEIKVYTKDECEGTLFMNYTRKPTYDCKNEILEIEKQRFIIRYENIKEDFTKIYLNSEVCFERIETIMQMYLDSLEKEMPRLNKFLAFCQMIEGFSREYDNQKAGIEKRKIDPENKNLKDIELKYRIYSLIKNVNYIYNFKKSKRLKISKKIALGRNFYIHNDKLKKRNELTREELFKYTYFLEDVLLANIYIQLGIKKEIIKSAFEYTFFYEKNKL